MLVNRTFTHQIKKNIGWQQVIIYNRSFSLNMSERGIYDDVSLANDKLNGIHHDMAQEFTNNNQVDSKLESTLAGGF